VQDDGGTANGGVDTDQSANTITVNVTAVNDAPSNVTASVSANSISENGSTTLTGSFEDPDIGQAHSVTINWGDGSTNTSLNLAAGVTTFSTSHQYLDDNPTSTASDVNTINVTVSDNDGGSGTASASVTVNNVAPVVDAITGAPSDPKVKGSSVTISANFTDQGTADTHLATICWDYDTSTSTCKSGASTTGTVIEPSGSTPGKVAGTRTYSAPGVFIIQVTVTDDDGTAHSSATTTYTVIYDPSGGFVTGGGWIDSPAGACMRAPCTDDTIGRANFGFVSKYQKGNNVPTGETEFQFKAGDLNFHSSSYEWLVVTNFKGQYKGVGTINGTGSYNFMLTAIDGQVNGGGGADKFRMRIWGSSGLVYDNQLNAPDSADPTTTLRGGSITVHSK
jgi:hypothetical protein